jgi:two-component system, OmpR family, response regulator
LRAMFQARRASAAPTRVGPAADSTRWNTPVRAMEAHARGSLETASSTFSRGRNLRLEISGIKPCLHRPGSFSKKSPAQRMRILVVDDDTLTLDFLAKKLRNEGYAIDTADKGEDGLYKAQNWDYDAIVLDVVLPGLDGWDILTQLRQTKKTPVLMLTSRNSTDDHVRGLDIGADDYVIKPFEISQLLARLRALIRRATQHAHSVIEIDEVEIDLTARTVTRGGNPISLSPREYAIVEYLAPRRGEIVTRTALYEHLFDENDETFSNVIDVHVGKIRKKLGKDFIVTRHGHGYSIAA